MKATKSNQQEKRKKEKENIMRVSINTINTGVLKHKHDPIHKAQKKLNSR